MKVTPKKRIVGEKLLQNGRVIRSDGYQNLINRYGTSRDSSEAYTFSAEPIVPDMVLTEHYEANGLFTKIIDRPADEALKRSFTLNINEPGLEQFYKDVLDELDWEVQASTAIKWARLYGGSIIVMMIDDGGKLEDPVNWNRVRDIDELLVFERAVVTPDYTSMYNDFSTPGAYGRPKLYNVNSGIYGNFTVHSSRCLSFKNGILPERVSNSTYLMWGMPEYMRVHRALKNTWLAHDNSFKLLDRAVQAVYKMKDLAKNLATEKGEEHVLQRLQLIDMARGILNSLAIDAEGEDYDFKTITFTGVKDIIDAADNMLSAVSDIPQVILFGRSPAGQNSTGESDFENFYNMVDRIRNLMLKRPLNTVLDVIS